MEKDKNIPSNYVSLVQLRQRWEEQQHRKQIEKEEQELKQNQESESNSKPQPQTRRNSTRQYRRTNLNFKENGPAVAVVVEGNESESGVKETNIKVSGANHKKKWKNKNKLLEDREVARAHAPPVRSMGNIPARRVEFRPKITSAFGKGDPIGKIENMVKEREETAEIESKLEDLSVQNDNNKQKRVFNRSNGGYNRNFNSRSRSVEYTGYRGRPHWGSGQSTERKGRLSGMIWVKKQEVAGGSEGAEDY